MIPLSRTLRDETREEESESIDRPMRIGQYEPRPIVRLVCHTEQVSSDRSLSPDALQLASVCYPRLLPTSRSPRPDRPHKQQHPRKSGGVASSG
jgi:hypothetical protein